MGLAAGMCRGPRCLGHLVAPLAFEVRGDMRARVIWRLFLERGLGWVPVVDETGHPIGTLLRDDLATVFRGVPRPGDEAGWEEDEAPLVEEVMRAEVAILRADAGLAEACALLDASPLPAVVVVDHRGTMLGTVSRATLRSHHRETTAA
jgi:CBS-domain-containing membrane protein